MKKRLRNFFLHQINGIALVVQALFLGIAMIVFLVLAVTAVVFQWNQMNKIFAPPLTIISSPTNSNSSSSSPNPQDQQILSEAQQDVNVANNIIAWSGFFIAIIASAVTVAGFFGIREFLRIRNLSNDFATQIQGVTDLKTRVETELRELHKKLASESQTLIEAAHNFSIATDAYKVGDNIRAIEYYLQVLNLQPENKLVMERLGRAYSNLNDINKAIDYLENKALAIDPSYVPALRSLALCHRYIDKDKAIDYFQRALKLDPSDYETWDFLGLIYRDNQLIDEAISAHEQAFSLKRRPETQFYLSILYSIKGDVKRAKLMALNAENDLHLKDHDERIRPVWKDLIRAGVHIIEGNEDEAYKLVKTLSPYITTDRVYEAVAGHLKFLLEATDHDAWKQKFTSILMVK